MKKLLLEKTEMVTFREGCERYLNDCRTRNLREGTIGHYLQITLFHEFSVNFPHFFPNRASRLKTHNFCDKVLFGNT